MGRVAKTPFTPTPQAAAASTRSLQETVHRPDPTLRCQMLPPDAFFASRNAMYARNLCGDCRIRVECAELAIREESVEGCYFDGIRGGLSPAERRVVVRLRKKQAGA
jgi:hypothetical protein